MRGTRRGARRRSWRTVGIVVVAVGATALTGCTGADSGGGAGGKLRYGYDLSAQFTNTFDPAKSTGDCDQVVTHFIYDSLLRRNEVTGEPIPGIAKSWQVTGDAKRSITFHLRDDVRFTDGTKLDAAAVKASLLHNKQNSQLTTLTTHMDSVDVVDPLTVRVNLKDDQSTPFLYVMGLSRDGMIESPKAMNGLDKHPVGSGPFKLESFTPGEGISLVKNDAYWDKGSYDFPGIHFLQASTGPPAVASFKAGDLDLVRFEAESLPTLRKDASARIVTKKTEAFLRLEFRYGFSDGRKTPFDNELVRQAVLFAIDRKKINDVVQLGEGEVATQALPKDSPGYNPSLVDLYPFNPAHARELLARAGYPNGFSFTMAIPGPGIQNMQSQGELIQSMLHDVGITANIKPIAGSDIATTYYINAAGEAFAAAQLASSFFPGAYYDEFGKFQYVPSFNHSENPEVTDLTLRAQAAHTNAEAGQLVQQAAKVVMDGAMEAPIAFMPQFLAVSTSRVGGTVGGQRNICDPPDLSKLRMKSSG